MPMEMTDVCITLETILSSLRATYFATNFTTLAERPKLAIEPKETDASTTDQTPSCSIPKVFSRNRYCIKRTPPITIICATDMIALISTCRFCI
ncbi:hypothetical protein MNV_210043 [Candidatus Methanoperedens nitroreducens]|uniref:Uncharacterized protein n=1 Tax=Candidatus Methanoperedens nitratireducens TaxID=1392998 RepID=A0A284VNS1_9EURY|nr:hypothetical protein MNV_210043 [Candidatus Methanoperedens nitroreducens]